MCQSLPSPAVFTKTRALVHLCHWYFSFSRVNSDFLFPVDCVGFVPRDHLPHPSKHQEPRAAVTTAQKSKIPKNENPTIKRLLGSQELQIKRLRNVIIEHQNEIEKIKIENRTLKQVSPSLVVSLKCDNDFHAPSSVYPVAAGQ